MHHLELRWLQTQGGRNAADVLVDEEGRKFVYMGIPGGLNRVYLPSVEYLRKRKWNDSWLAQNPSGLAYKGKYVVLH